MCDDHREAHFVDHVPNIPGSHLIVLRVAAGINADGTYDQHANPRSRVRNKVIFMNKATRFLAMTGMAVVAGVTMGAGPASAATTTAAKPVSHDRIEGYYRSHLQCERAGRFGELRRRWERHDCNLVRFGRHRGHWQLEVSYRRGPFGHQGGHGPIHRPPFHH